MVKQAVLAVIYGLGALVVGTLALLAAVGPGGVLFPDTMLPMELREIAGAWLAIGFLPMLLVSMQFYRIIRRRAVFLPAGICLLAMLFWIGAWAVGMARSPVDARGGIVLPEPEKIAAVRFTSSELDLTFGGDAFVSQLLRRMSQAGGTGRESVQDVPDQDTGAIRIDLYFKRLVGKGRGGASTVFLYRDGDDLLLEQPFQGIYAVDGDLEPWLRQQIEEELAQGTKGP